MEAKKQDLVSALAISRREHIALVGGGGKTTLMFALAGDLLQAGYKVITATTTKIWLQEASQAPCDISMLSDFDWRAGIKQGLEKYGHVFVFTRPLDSGKVEGVLPEVADRLSVYPGVDHLILEADGASGRPLKAPAQHEPVIPSTATIVVAVIGLEALGKNFDESVVFRAPLFEKLTGLAPDKKITPDCLVKIFESPKGLFKGSPASARRIAFLNKADLLPDDHMARDLAYEILLSRSASVDSIVIGSLAKREYLLIGHKT